MRVNFAFLDENEQIDSHIDLHVEIDRLRKEKRAVILAHYYQDGELQDLADFVGDSLDLSTKAAQTDAKTIVFLGVRFMAEVAKILNPNKQVLLPSLEAGCSLESSCPADRFLEFKNLHPDHFVVTYINCSAQVKALSDVIVTSSNAEAIIRKIPLDQPILFAPDRHLGRYLIQKTGRPMVLWPGTCIVHEQFCEKKLIQLKNKYPLAHILAHPECPEAILNQAHYVGSTKTLLQTVQSYQDHDFLVATEANMIHSMKKLAPSNRYIPLPGMEESCACSLCPFMAQNTLERLYLCLKQEKPAIHLDETLRLAAWKPLKRMFDWSGIRLES
jgi:quinolinate synthase